MRQSPWRPTVWLHCTKEELERQMKSQEQLATELAEYTTKIVLLEEV